MCVGKREKEKQEKYLGTEGVPFLLWGRDEKVPGPNGFSSKFGIVYFDDLFLDSAFGI